MDFAVSAAAIPAGPAPTITTSQSNSLARFAVVRNDVATDSMACRPCSVALRISPMPPSSPAMNIPGTLVSKLGLTLGMSIPRLVVPKTSFIASNEQDARQAPCPIQAVGSTRTARPSINPRAPSGHALTQEAEPIHARGSITGCSEGGSVRPCDWASTNVDSCVARDFCRRYKYTPRTIIRGRRYSSQRFN